MMMMIIIIIITIIMGWVEVEDATAEDDLTRHLLNGYLAREQLVIMHRLIGYSWTSLLWYSWTIGYSQLVIMHLAREQLVHRLNGY